MTRRVATSVGLAVLWANVAQSQAAPQLRFSGDFRVRYEHTSAANGTPSVGREVVRFRIGLTYPLHDDITVRARLATGDPGDPNSTDVTLGRFLDDLSLSLDLASVELNRSRFGVVAGKFVNPFVATELVWDGDVNPQGVGGHFKVGKTTAATVTALYLVVDNQAQSKSSDMTGSQLALTAAAGSHWRLTGAVAFYDYRIRSLAFADGGDIRGNRRIEVAPGDTLYLSDFDLLDALVAVDYTGFGPRFPVRVLGDYVHNSGANDLNTGWEADVYVGRLQQPGDVRYRYGFGMAETDAVLAAFAHDNTTLGTNYEIHTLSADAVLVHGLFLNATLYHYRPHRLAAGGPGEYQTRLRLNAMVTF